MRVRIKICGMTRAEDIALAARLGADAIGLIFYPPSPRGVNIKQAQKIIQAVPAFLKIVGVFVNPEPEFLNEILRAVPLDLLQFHGEETPEYCAKVNRPYLKTVAMREDVDLKNYMHRYQDARGFLLDTYQPDLKGGTGKTFSWQHLPANLPKPIILAGGLNAQNVAQAITLVRPYAVDVVSGVEAEKGVKDAVKMAEFIKVAQQNL